MLSTGQILIEVPMVNPQILVNDLCSPNVERLTEFEDTWNWWNKFRSTADFSSKLSIALELSADIPSRLEITRWQGRQQRKFNGKMFELYS